MDPSLPVAGVPVEVVTKTGLTIAETGVLGALLVASVLLNIALVTRMMRVQDKRVEDQTKINALAEKMITTFAAVTSSLDRLIDGNRMQTQAMQSLKEALDRNMLHVIQLVYRGPLPPGGP